MTITASGRSALILATGLFAGLFVCIAAPSQATIGTNSTVAGSKSESVAGARVAHGRYVKHGAHRWKRLAHHGSARTALKSPIGNQSDDGDIASMFPSAIPPSVADANAQLTMADAPAGSVKPISGRPNNLAQTASDNPADTTLANDTQVVSADQLNDVDRALRESEATTTAAPVAASSETSSWDQASLIGKIFIGFGALLTMASAARMFMA